MWMNMIQVNNIGMGTITISSVISKYISMLLSGDKALGMLQETVIVAVTAT